MTHEPEITEPVDLCTPDGLLLNPAARGWSRRPLHRANLDGAEQGRNKRWDYWAILAGDLVVSCVYSDIDVIGLADTWWAHLPSGRSGGQGIITEPGPIRLPQACETEELHVARDGLELRMSAEGPEGTRLEASWSDPDGSPCSFDLLVAQPPGMESINVVVPWSDDTFTFTSKQVARPATGWLRIGDEEHAIGGEQEAWGVLDVGRGRWPSALSWNWGAGSGHSGDRVVGIQMGARWTAGTGATENGFVVDGRATKLGEEIAWEYDWDRPLDPWTMVDPGGQLEVELRPTYDKYTLAGDEKLGSEVHQVFGRYHGWIADDSGERIELDGVQGFAEEARQTW